jgi:cysteine desulfuration protein SufE
LIGEGGILALGAAGIQVNPNDDTAHLLKSAIEARTKIKVDVSGIPRQAGDLNPTMLVIGPKPMAGDVVSPVADELQPMTLENILADFQLLDDWEDRYRYVIELGRALPLLPEAARTEANKVRGCASQVWLATEVNGATAGAAPRLSFKGDSDAHIVRGLIAILFAIYSGRCADEIVRIDVQVVFRRLELAEHLTPQRSNGFASMVERICDDARRVMSREARAA